MPASIATEDRTQFQCLVFRIQLRRRRPLNSREMQIAWRSHFNPTTINGCSYVNTNKVFILEITSMQSQYSVFKPTKALYSGQNIQACVTFDWWAPDYVKLEWNIRIYYSLKIFRRSWLVPIPRLILHNQLVLTICGRSQQYTIDTMVYLIGNEAAWAIAN